MDDIRIKACNPDNEPEIAQLVSLFNDSYGERFPFRGVYDREFWHRNAGSRLVSLLAARRHKVLAHLATRREGKDRSLVQLCFPACHADFMPHAVEAAREAWLTLSGVAERQQWRAIYFGAFSDIELMQRISTEAFRLTTSAILPGYVPMLNPRCAANRSHNDRHARSHVALGVRTLTNPSDSSPLFVPARHRDIVNHLRASVGGVAPLAGSNTSGHIPADAAGIEEKYFKEWQAWHVFVRPSLVPDLAARISSLQPSAGRAFIFIDARDSACPEAADQLEQHGFLFCGLLPQLAGTECLVYAQPDEAPVDASAFLCPVARKLADYIADQESARPSRVTTKRAKARIHYATARP